MTIEQSDSENKGSFYIKDENRIIAEMTYSKAGTDKIIIDHTDVSDKYRGKKLGEQLVHKAVEYARINKLKVMPLCPFAKRVFEKKSEYSDVFW
jgi:predicted GNAT family acetyltransferase